MDSMYDTSTTLLNMSISEHIMNNRGSVLDVGMDGVNPRASYEVVKRTRKGKEIPIKLKTNQNSKCYITALDAALKATRWERTALSKVKSISDSIYAPAVNLESVVAEYKSSQVTIEGLMSKIDVLKITDSAWKIVAYSVSKQKLFVSKMVHKDQIGPREIAVLNQWARTCCVYQENLSRQIRDTEARLGTEPT
jgi:hypothetical protein